MNGYTKGEWKWYWRTDEEGNADCGVYAPGQSYSVCRAPRYQTEEQWAKDAPLLAAAPDMYEAARAIMPADFHEHPQDFAPEWHALAAALSKAESH